MISLVAAGGDTSLSAAHTSSPWILLLCVYYTGTHKGGGSIGCPSYKFLPSSTLFLDICMSFYTTIVKNTGYTKIHTCAQPHTGTHKGGDSTECPSYKFLPSSTLFLEIRMYLYTTIVVKNTGYTKSQNCVPKLTLKCGI
jgi:hypothetical protein